MDSTEILNGKKGDYFYIQSPIVETYTEYSPVCFSPQPVECDTTVPPSDVAAPGTLVMILAGVFLLLTPRGRK
jgi:hypothetical protein